MINKPTVSVDIDDTKFARFHELFNKYNAQLGKMPNAWKAASKESAAMASQFERMTAALLAQMHISKEMDKNEKKQVKQLTQIERIWVSMSHSTKSVARNILSATGSLLRWTNIIGLTSGLLGVGGFLGIDRMAAGVADQRRTRMGLGLSSGQKHAFGISFGRFVNPDAFLGNVAAAGADISKQGPLYALGVNPNGSTADTALAVMRAVRARVMGTKTGQLGLLETQFGLGSLGYSTEDLRRIKNTSNDEWGKQYNSYAKNAHLLGYDKGTGRKWQDFTTQMELAGALIHKTFVAGLSNLAGPLTHLSQSIMSVWQRLSAKNGPLTKAINIFADWINNLATKVGQKSFLDKISQFVTDIGAMFDKVHSIVWAWNHPDQALVKGAENLVKSDGSWYGDMDRTFGDLVTGLAGGAWGAAAGVARATSLAATDASYKLPSGTLEYLFGRESSFGKLTRDKNGKDKGPFQIEPRNANGIDVHDFDQAKIRAAQIIARELKHYNGNLAMAIGAYNLGENGLARVMSQYGANWQKHVPDLVNWRQHVPHVVVHNVNSTGGNSHASVAGLSAFSAALAASL